VDGAGDYARRPGGLVLCVWARACAGIKAL